MSSNLHILREAGSAVIADVFDSMHRLPLVLDNSLRPVGESVSFAGPAYTITGESVSFTGGDRAKLGAIDAMPPGVVALWAGTDIRGVCCFGDLLATAMLARGCVAAVVDGGVRDVGFLRSSGLPVLSRYVTPAQGVGRWRVTAVQTVTQVRGALQEWIDVSPGDLLVGDADGVILIPQADLDQVTASAAAWAQSDTGAREEIRRGLPLLAALAKYGHL